MSTRLPVSEATELTPSANETGLRTPTASGPIFTVNPGVGPIAVASANASKVAISPIHTASNPASDAASAI